jgi:5-methylcytosine-specific restriction protein B
MTLLTQDRQLILYDREGVPYRPVRDGGTGKSIFKIKPEGASNRAEDAIHTEDWSVVARSMLIDGLAARCKALSGGSVNYLKFGAQKLVRYELDPQIARALGIPAEGNIDEPLADFSRLAIETAIDAFDAYRSNGAHAEIFKGFGEPRDYWVRSTRHRENLVYPTKPIVGFILRKTELNGGWGQKSDAASRLHNAGFIVVDQNDQPQPVPEQYEHLMWGADRARIVALNYFIEPARERGDTQVVVRIGDVSENLFPNNHYRNVWQALKGKAFQDLANVPEPTQSGADESPATTLTYQLNPLKEQSNMVTDKSVQAPTTNLILYGPPGTGKTYHTAWEAVRLCLGDVESLPFKGDEKRDALMTQYRTLVSSGRIEFVTFHQSMSYEEFVEGLRPDTGDGSDESLLRGTTSNAGFRLKPEPGVFKSICELAQRNAGVDVGTMLLEPNRSIFKLAINGQDPESLNKRALEEGLIFWTRGGEVDWTPDNYSDFNEVRDRWQTDYPDADGRGADISGTFYFRSVVEIGDYVVLTWGRDTFLALGKVVGDYEYRPQQGVPPHRRKVEWLWKDWENGNDREGYFEKKFSAWQPIYEFTDTQINRDALNTLLQDTNARGVERIGLPHVLIIDEINRANISKVFGELITLLEPDKRIGMANEIRLTLPYSKKRFGVPPNLHIIGTMNTADRSIALLDTALRRRFTFRELMPDPTVLSSYVEGINLQNLLRAINERIEYLFDREHQIGHAYFTGCDTRAKIAAVMRYKVIPLLAEYFYEDWSKVAAVLGDAAQDKPRFLVREVIAAPTGLDTDTFSGERHRWCVRPEVQGDKNGGFDFREFEV